MARPTVRDKQLTLDEIQQIKTVFGTAANAYARLSLADHLPMTEFRRALGWLPVKQGHGEAIQEQWARWKGAFLRDPGAIDLTLHD